MFIFSSLSFCSSLYDELSFEHDNDITLVKKEALEKYIRDGMMVVFSDVACEAYRNAVTQGYNQHKFDPDSNMYDLFAECINADGVFAGLDNVLLDFNPKDVVRITNPSGAYGNTYSGYVTVFGPGKNGELDFENNAIGTVDAGVNENDLLGCMLASHLRPKFVLTSAPTPYNEYDSSYFFK